MPLRMAGRQTKWRLEDVVDFEALLAGGAEGVAVDGRDRAVVVEAAGKTRNEGKKRRWGLRAWLEERREEDGPGRRTVEGLRLVGVLAGVLAFLAGIGLVRGLLQEFEGGRRMFNIWMFLGVTVGLQWLILLGGAAGYVFVRQQSGALSLGQRVLGMLVRRMGGRVDGTLWRSLVERGLGYRSALVWRLARMAQGVAVAFNVGLMAGFFGCLWVLKVGFYWESTIFKPHTIQGFGEAVAFPWAWMGKALPPEIEAQRFDLLHQRFYEDGGGELWWAYLMMVLVVWGLLPRLVLWVICWVQGRRALAGLEFQEVRHRELWRRLMGVQRDLPTEGPADGVVLLDVGGSGVETGALREFLLRELRVHPEHRYEAAVLDADREAEAWEAISKAPLGVVFLVEGWALSPKQMDALYRRVRERQAKRPLRFLVLGAVHEGRPGVPAAEDFAQWKNWVDGLRDPSAEVVAYRELEAVEE